MTADPQEDVTNEELAKWFDGLAAGARVAGPSFLIGFPERTRAKFRLAATRLRNSVPGDVVEGLLAELAVACRELLDDGDLSIECYCADYVANNEPCGYCRVESALSRYAEQKGGE